MKVKLEAMKKQKKTKYPKAKNVNERYKLSKKYFDFLGKRTKLKTKKARKELKFKY